MTDVFVLFKKIVSIPSLKVILPYYPLEDLLFLPLQLDLQSPGTHVSV